MSGNKKPPYISKADRVQRHAPEFVKVTHKLSQR
ncbi:hypothetical protein DW964_04910 [Ruminococcus sp. AM47-2BH]|nr:hypothetical protein [Ruminococcus bicirculans (ex Wegman et al. 2014)]RGH33284.1 hypothetical protein DW964_04910 [Ruminococcus sp. AM47-2BH]